MSLVASLRRRHCCCVAGAITCYCGAIVGDVDAGGKGPGERARSVRARREAAAWRCRHLCTFSTARRAGRACGRPGAVVAPCLRCPCGPGGAPGSCGRGGAHGWPGRRGWRVAVRARAGPAVRELRASAGHDELRRPWRGSWRRWARRRVRCMPKGQARARPERGTLPALSHRRPCRRRGRLSPSCRLVDEGANCLRGRIRSIMDASIVSSTTLSPSPTPASPRSPSPTPDAGERETAVALLTHA